MNFLHTHKCKYCQDDYHCSGGGLCLKRTITCPDCNHRYWLTVGGVAFALLVVLAISSLFPLGK